jgi:hypothetical protein
MSTIPAMIRRYRELIHLTDEYAAGGDDATDTPENRAALWEMTDIEHLVVATPARTRADLEAKRRFITETAFPDIGDIDRLVEAILEIDAETVGSVAMPALHEQAPDQEHSPAES